MKEGTSVKDNELMEDIKKSGENEDFTIFQLYIKDGRKMKNLLNNKSRKTKEREKVRKKKTTRKTMAEENQNSKKKI